jgi:transposase InsO family protein
VVVFQDFLTKWPLVFTVPDQKAVRLARLLAEEVIPTFGVPESLLSDRGTNLLSHLMKDVCTLLGIKKLNTTAYHPQCDGMLERFNRTLKAMLRKHAAKFGTPIHLEYYGHTETPPTNPQKRSHPSFCLDLIVAHQRKQLSFPHRPSYLPMSLTIDRNSSYHYLQLESWPLVILGKLNTSIKPSTTNEPTLLTIKLEIG